MSAPEPDPMRPTIYLREEAGPSDTIQVRGPLTPYLLSTIFATPAACRTRLMARPTSARRVYPSAESAIGSPFPASSLHRHSPARSS